MILWSFSCLIVLHLFLDDLPMLLSSFLALPLLHSPPTTFSFFFFPLYLLRSPHDLYTSFLLLRFIYPLILISPLFCFFTFLLFSERRRASDRCGEIGEDMCRQTARRQDRHVSEQPPPPPFLYFSSSSTNSCQDPLTLKHPPNSDTHPVNRDNRETDSSPLIGIVCYPHHPLAWFLCVSILDYLLVQQNLSSFDSSL